MYSQSGMNGECKAQRGALKAMDPNTLIILFCFSAREDFVFCADGESLFPLNFVARDGQSSSPSNQHEVIVPGTDILTKMSTDSPSNDDNSMENKGLI